jgi:hypothetical protein
VGGIDNYTVVQSVMGFQTTTYLEKERVDGLPVCVPRSSAGSEAGEGVPASPYRLYTQIAERATLEGTAEVDGETTHVLVVTDFEGVDLDHMAPGDDAEGWTTRRMELAVDEDEYVPRRITLEGTVDEDGEGRPASFTVHLRDYRTVEGMMHPFRMQITSEGFAPGMSAEERSEMRRSLEQMRTQMQEMSAQQRAMMEKVMGGKLEKMEKMLASGALDLTVEVKEVRVNTGPPSDGS